MKNILEVCTDSLASARAAIAGGADRLELCSALLAGGLTPYEELLRQIRRESDIEIRCLMRPRSGDFLYDREEILMMARQMESLGRAGADGFVIGCLTPEGELDREALKPLMRAAGEKKVTLHRAIDVSKDLATTYRTAGELGFDTVLTSGGAVSCIAGMETIGELLEIRRHEGGPEVLIGAGVDARAIRTFRERFPGIRAFHMSGKKEFPSGMKFRRKGVPMGLPGLDEWHIQRTDQETIRMARITLDEVI